MIELMLGIKVSNPVTKGLKEQTHSLSWVHDVSRSSNLDMVSNLARYPGGGNDSSVSSASN